MTNLERIPQSPPHISPLPEGEERPLWSVMIPTYNCSQYLEKTINSVLQQYPGRDKMHVEVVDDHSTDTDVAALVEKCGKGIVKYHRQEHNVGHLRNFETCINRAKGQLIHLLHGDDYVMEGFYNEIEHLFALKPEAGAAFTDFYFVDEQDKVLYTEVKVQETPGEIKNAIELIGRVQRIQTPAIVVKRSVYEKLGSFYAVKCCEDWLMWVKVTANYPLLYSPKHLACYRIRKGNNTSDTFVTGQFVKDIKTVFSINEASLPADRKKAIMKKAKRHWSIYEAAMSHKLYHDYKNTKAAINLANAALQLNINIRSLVLVLKLYMKLITGYKK